MGSPVWRSSELASETAIIDARNRAQVKDEWAAPRLSFFAQDSIDMRILGEPYGFAALLAGEHHHFGESVQQIDCAAMRAFFAAYLQPQFHFIEHPLQVLSRL
jgi:hypothetical protein